jgi:hypothetical protein
LWKFSHVSTDYERIAFVAAGEVTDEIGPAFIHLGKVAQIIDVASPDAVNEVRRALASTG